MKKLVESRVRSKAIDENRFPKVVAIDLQPVTITDGKGFVVDNPGEADLIKLGKGIIKGKVVFNSSNNRNRWIEFDATLHSVVHDSAVYNISITSQSQFLERLGCLGMGITYD
ncbi:MAG: hypothetical protein KAI70_00570 [Candidatus Omnitrophica bacterium]|nr:hypothetical protein [Candidatus Omnitrophota bacterium]